jgi:hypothetical protein
MHGTANPVFGGSIPPLASIAANYTAFTLQNSINDGILKIEILYPSHSYATAWLDKIQ